MFGGSWAGGEEEERWLSVVMVRRGEMSRGELAASGVPAAGSPFPPRADQVSRCGRRTVARRSCCVTKTVEGEMGGGYPGSCSAAVEGALE